MLKNLIIVALRNFRRDKWYTLLNILGLTIGITFSLFLIFYILDELSYDRYNQKADRIYRIGSFIKEANKPVMKWPSTQYPLGPALAKEYPEVEESVRFVGKGKTLYKIGDKTFYEEKIFYADSNAFRVFTYPFLEGDPRTALVAPKSIVLTESVAKQFFGNSHPVVGQSLKDGSGDYFKVTGVVKDVPANSHFRFNMLISNSTLDKNFANNWGGFFMFTYVLLRPNTNSAAFEKKLLALYDEHMAEIFAKFNVKIHYVVEPITWIHLHSDLDGEPEETGSMSYIYIFSAVALFMLIIACINYMNLTTARSARRAKEIGVRKVTGSTKPQLVAQFLIESTAMTVIALLLSMGLVALLLPTFNTLSGKSISFGALLEPDIFGILIAIILFVGLLGGSYPALYLSKFDPIHILKGNLSKGSSNVTLRRVLVVTQFSIAMIMLICTLVVYGQLNYLRNIDIGYDRARVATLAVNGGRNANGQIRTFTNEIRKDPHCIYASTAQAVPGQDIGLNLYSVQTDKGFTDQGVNNYAVDENYFKTMGIKIVKGRDFSGLPDTANSIIVNQNMVKFFGWGDNPIGKRVKFTGDTSQFHFEVVGVVKDFNQRSLYNPIAPLMFFYRPNSNIIQVKLDGKDIAAGVTALQKAWHTAFPDLPFEYKFLDQTFNSAYEADQKRGRLFTTFSVVTILITCLGLLGLIAFTTQQRQKEISVRKVMGAGTGQLVILITRNFVALVAFSCIFACPAAWYFMSKWLKIFPYNTGLSFTPFLLASVTVLVITLLTVIFHTMRAALASPALSLRSE
ncbi:MAG TPA: ABC transporter permease [Puia sp.]|jgi:putative ABC transport system permease protein|nr:ABC transporter permease [Puia sp.]